MSLDEFPEQDVKACNAVDSISRFQISLLIFLVSIDLMLLCFTGGVVLYEVDWLQNAGLIQSKLDLAKSLSLYAALLILNNVLMWKVFQWKRRRVIQK